MKIKAVVIWCLVLVLVCGCISDEKYLKSKLITPTDLWTDQHGDSLDSWQVYNTAVLVEEVKKLRNSKRAE